MWSPQRAGLNIFKGDLGADNSLYYRGLFIIDDKGTLRQITINDLPVGRSVEETLRLVQAFQFTDKHGEGMVLCCVCILGLDFKFCFLALLSTAHIYLQWKSAFYQIITFECKLPNGFSEIMCGRECKDHRGLFKFKGLHSYLRNVSWSHKLSF